MELSTGYLIFFTLVIVTVVLAAAAITYHYVRDSAKRRDATETKKPDKSEIGALLRKTETSLLLLQGVGAILGTAMIMLVVILVFVSYLPTWRLGYDAAGGGAWWVILFVTVAMVAVAVLVKGRILRGVLLTPLILLLFATVLIPLTSGFINRPVCLEDDIACHKAVALAEAEKHAAELAEANRRAAVIAAIEKAKYTSEDCPGEPQEVTLEGDVEITISPGTCVVKMNFDGLIDAIDAGGNVVTMTNTTNISNFWTVKVRSTTGDRIVLHYMLTNE